MLRVSPMAQNLLERVSKLRATIFSEPLVAKERCGALQEVLDLATGEDSNGLLADQAKNVVGDVLMRQFDSGALYKLAIVAIEGCGIISDACDDSQAARAWLCARVLFKVSQGPPSKVLISAIPMIKELWNGSIVIEYVAEIMDVSFFKCLKYVESQDIVDEILAHSEVLLGSDKSTDSLPLDTSVFQGVHTLGYTLAENKRMDVLKRVTLWSLKNSCYILEPLWSGFVECSELDDPEYPVEAVGLELCKSGRLDGNTYFDASVWQNWTSLNSLSLSESVRSTITLMQQRALDSLSALDHMVKGLPAQLLLARKFKKILLWVVITCGGWHTPFMFPWKSRHCEKVSTRILVSLKTKFRSKSDDDDSESAESLIISNLLSICCSAPEDLWSLLRQTLRDNHWREDQWQTTGAFAAIFLAVVHCNERDLLSGNAAIGEIVPIILSLIDSTDVEIEAVGVKLFAGLFRVITRTEYGWYANLFDDRLHRLVITSHEPSVIEPMLEALKLRLIEYGPYETPCRVPVTFLEKMLDRVPFLSSRVSDGKGEQVRALALWMRGMGDICDRLRLHIVQFLPRLIDAACKGASCGQSNAKLLRAESMNFLILMMNICSPRVPDLKEDFLCAICRNRCVIDDDSETELNLNQKAFTVLASKCCRSGLEAQVLRLQPYVGEKATPWLKSLHSLTERCNQ